MLKALSSKIYLESSLHLTAQDQQPTSPQVSQSELAVKAASLETTMPWSCHPVYARCWPHYCQEMAWMRNHQNAYRKAVESCFSSLESPGRDEALVPGQHPQDPGHGGRLASEL